MLFAYERPVKRTIGVQYPTDLNTPQKFLSIRGERLVWRTPLPSDMATVLSKASRL